MSDLKGLTNYLSIMNDYIDVAKEIKKELQDHPIPVKELDRYISHINSHIIQIMDHEKLFEGHVTIKGSPSMMNELEAVLNYLKFEYGPEDVTRLNIDTDFISISSWLGLNTFINPFAFSYQICKSDTKAQLPTEMVALVPQKIREILW